MTSQDLRRLRELLAAATPGPWFTGGWPGQPEEDVCVLWGTEDDDGHGTYLLALVEGALLDKECRADADLIAAMRNALPGLLDEVEQLRAENAAANEYANQTAAETISVRDDCVALSAENTSLRARVRELEAGLRVAQRSLEWWAPSPAGHRWLTVDQVEQDPNGTHAALGAARALLCKEQD